MTDKPQPGGLRNPPGGRPKLPEDEKKVKINITISPALHAALLARRDPPTEKLSQVIERLLLTVLQ